MATCLVTGGSGYIGSHLVRYLLEQGHQVLGLVRPTADRSLLPQGHPELQILETHNLKAISAPVEVVFHLAAHCTFAQDHESIDALVDANLRFGTHLLETMKTGKIPYLINAASFAESCESEDYQPQNLYAATKFCFQRIIDYYVQKHGLKAISLRLMDVYGPNDTRQKIWPQLVKSMSTNQPLGMTAGQQWVNPVHVHDVCNAFVHAWTLLKNTNNDEHKTYYVAGTQTQSLKETVAVLEQIAGKTIPIRWGERPYREGEIMRPYIGPLLPNWAAQMSLKQGFTTLIEA